MTTDKPTTKRQLLERLLEDGMVMITLDARFPGADAPVRLAEEPQLRLNLSYKFGLPIDINDWGVRATLTFGGMPFPCKLPWPAIYAMVSHVSAEQYLFPDDVPEEVASGALKDGDEAASGPEAPGSRGPVPLPGLAARLDPEAAAPPRRARPRFALVERAEDDAGPDAPRPDPAPAASAEKAPEVAPVQGQQASEQAPAAPRKGGHLRRIK